MVCRFGFISMDEGNMTSNSIKSIHDLLNEYRDLIQNNRDLGTSFERLVKSYLETDPIYKDLFPKVSMWTEWEHCWGPDPPVFGKLTSRN